MAMARQTKMDKKNRDKGAKKMKTKDTTSCN